MPSYLVETFLPRCEIRERAAEEQRARSAAEALSRVGHLIRFEHSIHIPSDETCFFVFEASSTSDVALAAERAGLRPLRIVETAPSRKENG